MAWSHIFKCIPKALRCGLLLAALLGHSGALCCEVKAYLCKKLLSCGPVPDSAMTLCRKKDYPPSSVCQVHVFNLAFSNTNT